MVSWSGIKKDIYKNYSKSPGKMLVHTGVIGWILSSAAQIFAVMVNDKISPEQKMFLIPQEAADAGVNILSFYCFTNGIKHLGTKLTRTAKIRTDKLTKLLEERGHVLKKGQLREAGKVYAGDLNFDVTKLEGYEDSIEKIYKPFNNGVEVIAGLTGSIISSNMITPIVRNYYAAKRQKAMIARIHNKNTGENPLSKTNVNCLSNSKYPGIVAPFGNLKI